MECDDQQVSRVAAVVSCLAMSSMYVGSLYLVPQRFAKLHRDHPVSSSLLARVARSCRSLVSLVLSRVLSVARVSSLEEHADLISSRTSGLGSSLWVSRLARPSRCSNR
jgi:hypothetical protein